MDTERKAKPPPLKRTQGYLLFIDLKKAFDKVDRHQLLKKMKSMGIAPEVMKATATALSDATIVYNGTTVPTEVSCP